MTTYGTDIAGLFLVLMLILTLVSILAVTIRHCSPGHFKPDDRDRSKLQIEA